MELNYNAAELDELLRPSQFDWADESEELEEQEGEQSETSISEGELEEAMASFYELERQPSTSSGEPDNEEDEWSNFDEAMVQEDSDPLIDSAMEQPEPDSQEEERKKASIQEDVNLEFAFRQACIKADGGFIHHFNWMGCPTYGYSSTPPAISLLFLVAEPKIPRPGDEWRLDAIMRQAMRHVDPVLVYLENGLNDLLRRGFDLIQWATGRVHKCYTPHGNWQRDPRDMEDGTVLEAGDVNKYMESTLAFGTGYMREYTIRSRAQWESRRQALYLEHAHPSQSRSETRPYKPSPLRQAMVPEDFEDEADTADTEDIAEPEIEKPASRLLRRRAFSESSCDLFAGLRRELFVHGSEPGLDAMVQDNVGHADDSDNDDSDDDCSDIGEHIQLTYQEFTEAGRRRRNTIERAAAEPGLEPIPEENEDALENEAVEVETADQMVEQDDRSNEMVEKNRDTQKDLVEQPRDDQNDQLGQKVESVEQDANQEQDGQNDQPGSPDKKGHQRISGTDITSGSETIHHIANEPQNEVASDQSPISDPKRWKNKLRHLSKKARKALRSKDAQFAPTTQSSASSDSAASPTFHLSHSDTPRDSSEKASETSSAKELATKFKSAWGKSSSEKATAAEKQKRISLSEIFSYGTLTIGSYSLVMI